MEEGASRRHLASAEPRAIVLVSQPTELCWQLRGEADRRQVEGAKLALQHNLGLGGAGVVAMYRKADFS